MLKKLTLENTLNTHYLGPHIDEGPLPAVFYFCISAQDSLSLDPIHQPARACADQSLRIFSVDLPFHESYISPDEEPIRRWAEALKRGTDFISPFCDQMRQLIDELVNRQVIDPDKIGLMGLSRGVLLACHLALHIQTKAILGFSPLLRFDTIADFSNEEQKLIDRLSLFNYLDTLYSKTFRFYMGNCDTKTSTKTCMDFILHLADRAYEKGLRSSPIELIIGPSIGYKGHGTTKETFTQGAQWLKSQLIEVSH
ncbi:MAG: hypothetical protein K9M07_00290 [Simkaniaceae bacterium]|nr:hypothetical protein [Simkaniaceae bacterium]